MKNAREREKSFSKMSSELGKLTYIQKLPIRNYQIAQKVNICDRVLVKMERKSKKSCSTKILEMQIKHISK